MSNKQEQEDLGFLVNLDDIGREFGVEPGASFSKVYSAACDWKARIDGQRRNAEGQLEREAQVLNERILKLERKLRAVEADRDGARKRVSELFDAASACSRRGCEACQTAVRMPGS